MQAKDLDAYLKSLAQVPEKTVDRIIIGSPETEIIKIGTAWMPYWDTCRAAVEQGINVLVVHEPTFYTHWDRDGEALYPETLAEKQRWIEAAGLVIIRCHDVLDKIQTPFGIPFAFGRGLGFSDGDILRAATYYNVYRCPPTPALEIARRIAGHLKTINQPGVGFYGDGAVSIGEYPAARTDFIVPDRADGSVLLIDMKDIIVGITIFYAPGEAELWQPTLQAMLDSLVYTGS